MTYQYSRVLIFLFYFFISSTIAGSVAGVIIAIIVVAAIIFCICNNSNRGTRVTTIHTVQPTVTNVQTAHQQREWFLTYILYFLATLKNTLI